MEVDPRDLEITDIDKGALASFRDVWHKKPATNQSDYHTLLPAGFLDILGQLTDIGDVTCEAFKGIPTSILDCCTPAMECND